MVKGITRQVIMVDSPDPSIFDKAIFILKDCKASVAYEDILKEAQLIADNYLKDNTGRKKLRISPVLSALAGAALTGAAWLCVSIIK